MRDDAQVAKIRKIIALLTQQQKDMVASTQSLSPSVYRDEARLQQEIRRIFQRMPLILGRSAELAKAGDFMTRTVAGLPILLTRSESGIAGFLNICRHRGTQLVNEVCGNRQRFVCPYHAWTYDNSGRLLRIPDEVGFPGIDRQSRGLLPLIIAERHGFIWARLSDDTPLDIAAYLGALDADLTTFGLADQVVYQPRTFTVAMNWKLAIDIFLEAYHVRYTHHDSIYPIFFDNLALFEHFPPHQRNFFPKRTILNLAQEPPATWQLRQHCNILYHLFPNSFLLLQPDHVSVFHIQPDGVNHSSVFAYTLIPELPQDEKAVTHWQKNIDILYGALLEDFAMGESIQRGASSGYSADLVLGRFEQSLQRFHDSVDHALAD